MIQEYVNEILAKGGSLPAGYEDDNRAMQVAKLQNVWRKLYAK